MSKQARSARGQIVDFDLLAIKQQLAKQPVPVGVNQRRKFIDEKDGIKHRNQENFIVSPPPVAAKSSTPTVDEEASEMPEALAVAAKAAAASAAASVKKK